MSDPTKNAPTSDPATNDPAAREPTPDEPTAAEPAASTINIRNLSIKCGNCDTYQTLAAYSRRDEWNVYTYECDNEVCDPEVTRTYLEVPAELDEFARRDPQWRGGRRHGGAEG